LAQGADSVLDVVGNTPTVRLQRIPAEDGIRAKLYVKLEYLNPTGSLKDRIYKQMILGAIDRGQLKPGMEILEASTGNAGISCSFVGSLKGHKVTIVMPEGMTEEGKLLIKLYGGGLMLTPGGETDVDLCLHKIQEMVEAHPGKYWFADQFSNPDNPAAHYETTGPELFTQSGGELECFLAAVGSGGTLTGVAKFLRKKIPRMKVYAVEPAESPLLSRGRTGAHRIEGIGDGFVPRNLDMTLVDGVVTVSYEEAVAMTKRLMREEGLFCGLSSGCNVAAAVKISERHEELGSIATVLPDSANRYFSTEVFGVEKRTLLHERKRALDSHSVEQLRIHHPRLEVIE